MIDLFRSPNPSRNVGALLSTAVRLMQSRNFQQAQHQCRLVLQLDKNNADALNLMGLAAAQMGQHEEAIRWIDKSLSSNPKNPGALNNKGVALKNLGRFEEAIESFNGVVALKPDAADAYNNRGNAQLELKRYQEALQSYELAIAKKDKFAAALNNRGSALARLGRTEEAFASFGQAIAAKPDYADAYNNRGLLQCEQGDLLAGLASYDRALALRENYPEAHNNRGNALAKFKRVEEAITSYMRAIELNPNFPDAYHNMGSAFLGINRNDDALRCFEKAIELDPAFEDSHAGRGEAALKARRADLAATAYETLLSVNPLYPFVKGHLLHARMLNCDWHDVDALSVSIQHDLRAGIKSADPFGYQGISTSESDLRLCSEIYAASEYPPQTPLLASDGQHSPKPVITIGYLCGEFRQQATTILLCEVFELHDKSRFRLIAFDNGGSDGSEYRERIERCFDEIIDITRMTDIEAAKTIRAKDVDVLVNLNGYFGAERLGIFANRPSPVQVNYLGFPGTIGAPYIDYLIADATVIPPDSRKHYAECVAYLPHSYQANDRKRKIAPDVPQRREVGLPDAGFVFCCFNNNYKITPATFDAWMDILRQVDGSVLWLLANNDVASSNLRIEAQRRGIDPSRLVFSSAQAPAKHLARQQLADLFLDTLPYNAHTTASDALWAGLPVLTCAGSTFPGRVGASLLQALQMPELITENYGDYVSQAIAMARDPHRLAQLREKLFEKRAHAQLFDAPAFTRGLESAYGAMMDRCWCALAPAAIDLRVGPA